MNGESLVAVVGTGRNGSTLLGRLLDGSPELWLHPAELNYLTVWDDLARSGDVSGETVQNRTTRALDSLGSELELSALLRIYAPQWREIEADYRARLVPEDDFVPGDAGQELGLGGSVRADAFLPAFLDATRRAFGGPAQKQLLAFKTIETPYVDDYARVFPGIRFVHILRDPIAVYESLKRTRVVSKHQPFYAGGDHLRTFLDARWLPHARAIVRRLDQDPEHHLLVRYEDLRADATSEVRRICDWLGVETTAEPDRQTVFGGRRLTQLPDNSSTAGVATPEWVEPNMAERFGYADVLTPRERKLIARCTAPLAERFGYSSPQSSGMGLWLAWLVPDSDERLNRRSRLRWAWEVVRRRAYVTTLLLRPRRDAA